MLPDRMTHRIWRRIYAWRFLEPLSAWYVMGIRLKWNSRFDQTRSIIAPVFGLSKNYALENVAIAMHCNLRPPDATRQPCQVWSRSTYPLPSFITFHCWYVTLRCDLDRWPWTFVVYHLWPDETLYQIWVKSSNPWRSYCDLNVWPYDLEHVSHVSTYVVV